MKKSVLGLVIVTFMASSSIEAMQKIELDVKSEDIKDNFYAMGRAQGEIYKAFLTGFSAIDKKNLSGVTGYIEEELDGLTKDDEPILLAFNQGIIDELQQDTGNPIIDSRLAYARSVVRDWAFLKQALKRERQLADNGYDMSSYYVGGIFNPNKPPYQAEVLRY